MYPHPYQWYTPTVDSSMDTRRLTMRPFRFPVHRTAPSIDLRPWLTPVQNQAQTDACAANAFAGAIEYIIKRRAGHNVNVSRLFIYYNGRMIQQRSFEVTDGGASKRTIALGLRKFGVCAEFVWPYERNYIDQRPPAHVYDAASQISVVVLSVPRDLQAMKACLSNEVPFLIGIRLLPQATNEAKYNNGYVSMPNPNDPKILSVPTHAVLVVGYDDRTGHFIVRNSWGDDWGQNGYFYIPYQYVLENSLVNVADGVWAIPDVVRRAETLPTVRQLVVSDRTIDPRYQYNPAYYQTGYSVF
ncbi:hypothetical protein I4U23_007196 [Adineta vaga]|nr:hypothetical protein I4U23_007196 [Adineta vaga]